MPVLSDGAFSLQDCREVTAPGISCSEAVVKHQCRRAAEVLPSSISSMARLGGRLACALTLSLLAQAAWGQYTAELLGEEKFAVGDTLAAYYSSALFGGQVTVQVSPSNITLVTNAPSTLVAGLSKGASNVAMNETFLLPVNASQYTVVEHITVFYNPFGAFPYPTGSKNPLWSANMSRSLSCATCWFYVTFFFIPQKSLPTVAPVCATSPNFFCTKELVTAAQTTEPDADFLPKSFVPATGDFYPQTVVKATLGGQPLGNLKSMAEPVSPLIAAQLGQFWVSRKPAYTFLYNGTRILGAQNYYVTDGGQVIGVGQAVSRDYFSFFSDFFAHVDPVKGHLVDATGPFGVPQNFTAAGDYPAGALTLINGFKGTSTFTFGFTNTTFREPPTPPNAASNLVLNLPWLIASVWIAGAVVLLSDHL